MTLYNLNLLRHSLLKSSNVASRSLFYWMLDVFNSVDKQRIAEVGPDRACAEWLLKNGAAIRWKGCTDYYKDYNILIKDTSEFYIEAVDATDSGIYYKGFGYFAGCKFLREIMLNNCGYVNDRAMKALSVVKDTLTDLEIQNNVYITADGLRELKVLQNLKQLTLANIKRVKNKESIQDELAKALPECKVEYH